MLKQNQGEFGFMEDVDSRHHHHQPLIKRNIKKNEKLKKKVINQEPPVKRDSPLTNLLNKKLHLAIINKTLSRTLLHNSKFSTNTLQAKFRNIFHTLRINNNKTKNTSLQRSHLSHLNLTLESPKVTSGDKRQHYYHPVHRYRPHHLHQDDDDDEDNDDDDNDDDDDDRKFFKHHILPVEPITDMISPIQRMGHVEPIDPIDPMEPIDPIEPIERIREIEPVEPMEKIERMESLFPMKSIEEEDGEAKSKIPKRYNHTKRYNYSKVPSIYNHSIHRRYLSKHNLTNLYHNLAPHVVEAPIEHNPNDELKVTNDRVFMLPSGTTLVNLDDGHQNWHAILGARGSLGVLHPATGATGAVYSAKGAVESRVGVHEPASGVTKLAVGVTDAAKGSMKEAVKATGAGPDSKTEAGKKLPPNEGYKKDELTDCNKVDNSRVKNCTNYTDMNDKNKEITPQLLPPAGLDSVASLNNMIERLKNESNNFQDSQKYAESVVKLIHNLTKAFNSTNKEKLKRQRNLTCIDKNKLNENVVNLLINETNAISPENKQYNETARHINSTVSSGGKLNTTEIAHYHQLKTRRNEKIMIDPKQLEFELVEEVDMKYQNNNSYGNTSQALPEEKLFHSDSIDSTLHEYELVEDQIYDHKSKANKKLLSDALQGKSVPVFRDSIGSKYVEYELVEDQNTKNVSLPRLKQTLSREDLKGRSFQHYHRLNLSCSKKQLTEHSHIMPLNDTDKLNTSELLPKVNNSIYDRKNTVVMLDGRSNSSKLGKDDSEKQFQQNNNKQFQINETKGIFSPSVMLKKSPSSISIGDRRGIVIPKFPNPPISSRIEEFKDPEPIKPIKMKKIPIPIKDLEIKESLDEFPDIEPIDLGQLTTRLMDEPIKLIERIESKIPDIKKNPVIEPISLIEVM